MITCGMRTLDNTIIDNMGYEMIRWANDIGLKHGMIIYVTLGEFIR
jgi:hypothetical protein